jgi:hypothetical protein
MNGNYGFNESEAYDEALDESMDESMDEANDEAYDEAKRGKRPFKPLNMSRAASAYMQKPSRDAVTQAQLKAVLARVSQQINTNSKAIKVVDGRVRSVSSEQARVTAGLRKELADRKKAILDVRKDLQSTREITAILPLLTTLGGGSGIAAFAPLLLLGNDVSSDTPNAGGGLLGGLGGGGLTGIIALLAITGGLGATK